MKNIKVRKPRLKKYRHAKIKVPKRFMWTLLRKVHDDLISVSNGDSILQEELRLFDLCIRRRDVQMYLEHCDNRWSLSHLCKREPAENLTLQQIRVMRLFTIAKKHIFAESPYDVDSAAADKFRLFEEKCRVTNCDAIFGESLTDEENPELSTYDSLFVWPVFQRAREFIAMVLGDDYNLSQLLDYSHHGPGASLGRHGVKSIPIGKYFPPYTTTSGARSLVQQLFEQDDRLRRAINDSNLQFDYESHEHAKIMFVPKNAKTSRTIMIESTGNICIQLGVDRIIRKRLLRFGIDISTQTKNQRLAGQYSLSGQGVTVDLSGASDTIAMNWLLLFPPKWAELLFQLRTPIGILERKNMKPEIFIFEKLSSMGNGFTFVIETLIFSALLYGVIRENGGRWRDEIENLAVYGDDIILPKGYFPQFAAILKRCGFKLNMEKSFFTNKFRESCGSDFFNGYDISVFNVPPKISDHCDINVIHNSLFSVEDRFGIMLTLSRLYVMDRVPEESRSYGPPSEETNGYFFTNHKPLNIYFNRGHFRLYYRMGVVRKIRPDFFNPLSRLFGPEIMEFTPLMYLADRGRTDDSWSLKIGCWRIWKGPDAGYSPLQGALNATRYREELFSCFFDKQSYKLVSSVVSRPLL